MKERNYPVMTIIFGIFAMALTFFVFLALKLLGTIDWSWWWITAPLWIPWGLTLAVLLVVLIIYIIQTIIDRKRKTRNE